MMTKQRHLSSQPESGTLFDEMLVVMAQNGDRSALERLYQRWNIRLLRAARRYCGDEDAASDLSQDCWLAVLKRVGTLRDPTRFRSYAFAILHRRGADHLRHIVRERGRIEDDAQMPDPSCAAGQSDGAAIAQAFSALPPDQRLAAHLHFVEGLTLREIAEVQSIPEGTAKSRLFHARRKLKAALDPNPKENLNDQS